MSENYLIHYGNKNSGRYPRGSGENPHQHDGLGVKFVKGMQSLQNRHARRKVEKQLRNQKYKIKPKDLKKLSDEDLDKIIVRLNKEKTMQTLVKDITGKGKSKALSGVGEKIIKTAATGAGLYVLSAAVGGNFDRRAFGNAIFNGGAKKK